MLTSLIEMVRKREKKGMKNVWNKTNKTLAYILIILIVVLILGLITNWFNLLTEKDVRFSSSCSENSCDEDFSGSKVSVTDDSNSISHEQYLRYIEAQNFNPTGEPKAPPRDWESSESGILAMEEYEMAGGEDSIAGIILGMVEDVKNDAVEQSGLTESYNSACEGCLVKWNECVSADECDCSGEAPCSTEDNEEYLQDLSGVTCTMYIDKFPTSAGAHFITITCTIDADVSGNIGESCSDTIIAKPVNPEKYETPTTQEVATGNCGTYPNCNVGVCTRDGKLGQCVKIGPETTLATLMSYDLGIEITIEDMMAGLCGCDVQPLGIAPTTMCQGVCYPSDRTLECDGEIDGRCTTVDGMCCIAESYGQYSYA